MLIKYCFFKPLILLQNGNRGHIKNVRDIIVDFVRAGKQPNFKPRRLGGGFGGRIKSSQLRFGGRDKPFY